MIWGIGPAALIVNMRTRIAPWPLALFALIEVKVRPAVVGVPLIARRPRPRGPAAAGRCCRSWGRRTPRSCRQTGSRPSRRARPARDDRRPHRGVHRDLVGKGARRGPEREVKGALVRPDGVRHAADDAGRGADREAGRQPVGRVGRSRGLGRVGDDRECVRLPLRRVGEDGLRAARGGESEGGERERGEAEQGREWRFMGAVVWARRPGRGVGRGRVADGFWLSYKAAGAAGMGHSPLSGSGDRRLAPAPPRSLRAPFLGGCIAGALQGIS